MASTTRRQADDDAEIGSESVDDVIGEVESNEVEVVIESGTSSEGGDEEDYIDDDGQVHARILVSGTTVKRRENEDGTYTSVLTDNLEPFDYVVMRKSVTEEDLDPNYTGSSE